MQRILQLYYLYCNNNVFKIINIPLLLLQIVNTKYEVINHAYEDDNDEIRY